MEPSAAAYVIAEHRVTNAEKFEEYKAKEARLSAGVICTRISLRMPEGGASRLSAS